MSIAALSSLLSVSYAGLKDGEEPKLIWGTFVSELKDLYDATVKENPQSFFQKILFLIDEGGVTPIPELYDHIATCNGRGMSFVMGIQALSQLDAVYGKENAETILNKYRCKIKFISFPQEVKHW